jgi:hypothetical protein
VLNKVKKISPGPAAIPQVPGRIPPPPPHERICQDTIAKSCHLKKLTCKGLGGRCLSEFIFKLEMQSVILVFFRPSFVNCCPSNLFSASTLPAFPLPCVNKYGILYECIHYTYTVCRGWWGGGLWGSETQTDKHLPQSPFPGQFFR